MTEGAGKNFIDLTATIVSAYLSNNPTPASEIPDLIGQLHAALLRVAMRRIDAPAKPAKPGVSVEKSLNAACLMCREGGKPVYSLWRHLGTADNMPQQHSHVT